MTKEESYSYLYGDRLDKIPRTNCDMVIDKTTSKIQNIKKGLYGDRLYKTP